MRNLRINALWAVAIFGAASATSIYGAQQLWRDLNKTPLTVMLKSYSRSQEGRTA
jgi:hypothetical protein